MIVRVVVSLLIAVLAAAGTARAEDADVLNIYNWSDYIADDTVARFEAETGIKVHYDVYDSNEVLEATLLAWHSGYDLVVPSASPSLGRQAPRRGETALDVTVETLMAIRRFGSKFPSSQYSNALANGELCVAFGYSGDMIQAKNRAAEAKNGVIVAYSIPKEGAMMWVDMMAVPKDAPHAENALKFIDFILRPEIIAAISNTVAYANPNLLATDLVDEEMRGTPNIYPPADVRTRLFFVKPVTPQYDPLGTRPWTRVKTSSQ